MTKNTCFRINKFETRIQIQFVFFQSIFLSLTRQYTRGDCQYTLIKRQYTHLDSQYSYNSYIITNVIKYLKNDYKFKDSFMHFFTYENSFFNILFSKYAHMLAICVTSLLKNSLLFLLKFVVTLVISLLQLSFLFTYHYPKLTQKISILI